MNTPLNPQGPLVTPDLAALLLAQKRDILASLNCHQIGEIVSYDRVRQAATVKIASQRVVYNRAQPGDQLQGNPMLVDYPILTDVPVLFPMGGGGHFFAPVKPGDACLVLFNDRDIDAWFETGSTAPPNSPRLHSLSDGIALTGLRSVLNPSDAPAGYAGFQNGGGTPTTTGWVLIDEDGNVQIGSGGKAFGIFNASGEATLQNTFGARVTVNPDGKIIISANGSSPSMIFDPSTGKITMSAAGNTLLSLLDTLCGVLTAWVNTGGSTPNPATVAAIAALKAQIDATFS